MSQSRGLPKQDLGYFVAKHSNKLTKWFKEQRKKSGFDSGQEGGGRQVVNILRKIPLELPRTFFRIFEFRTPSCHDEVTLTDFRCPSLWFTHDIIFFFHFRLLPLLSSDNCDAFEQLKNQMPDVFSALQTVKRTGHQCDVVSCFHQIVKDDSGSSL